MSALSSTAVLPLVTTASIADHSDLVGYSRPDLAARFDDIYARWLAQREKDRLELAACDQAEREGGAFALSDNADRWAALNDEIADVVELIASAPVTSLVDLALQARACALNNALEWTDSDEAANAGASAYRRLVDNIMGLVGGQPLPGVAVVPFERQEIQAA
ncbi:hypothetical protein WI560_13560 [Bradyrhizobium sp. A11]|uniref:hypothetical protein n=1 Tax=Bradyrhizobium sp. A11 TaxID=3133974 RepID=UPI00324878B6